MPPAGSDAAVSAAAGGGGAGGGPLHISQAAAAIGFSQNVQTSHVQKGPGAAAAIATSASFWCTTRSTSSAAP